MKFCLDFLTGLISHNFGEDQLNIILFTDCKYLYGHLKKDGAVPEDKWVAVAVASVKCVVSAGAGRDTRRAECRWIASRWQLADCLTKCGAVLDASSICLHELSLQQIKRSK